MSQQWPSSDEQSLPDTPALDKRDRSQQPQQSVGEWTPPPPTGRRRQIVVVVVGVIVVLYGIGSFVRSGGWDELQATLSGKQPLSDLQVGQCFDSGRPAGEDEGFGYASIVVCDEPHESELIETFPWSDLTGASEYPTLERIEAFAGPHCLGSFRSYAGQDFVDSELDMTFVYPSQEAWQSDDRSFHCIVHGPTGARMIGSIRNRPR